MLNFGYKRPSILILSELESEMIQEAGSSLEGIERAIADGNIVLKNLKDRLGVEKLERALQGYYVRRVRYYVYTDDTYTERYHLSRRVESGQEDLFTIVDLDRERLGFGEGYQIVQVDTVEKV